MMGLNILLADVPPFPTLLLIIGAILILLALAGKITIKEATVGIPQRGLRVIAGIIGTALIVVALSRSSSPTLQPSPSPTPSLVDAGKAQDEIPMERYQELGGKWVVWEKVDEADGGYEIVWNYDASVMGNQLTMSGKKVAVNEKTGPRKPRTDEEATSSVYTLNLKGLEALGQATEKDRYGTTPAKLQVTFAKNLKTFSGRLSTSETGFSSVNGSKQSPTQ